MDMEADSRLGYEYDVIQLEINGEDVVLDVAISREIAYNKGA
jgi:hypothetical protein